MTIGLGPWRWLDSGELVDADGKGVPFDWLKPRIAKLPDLLAMLRELEWAGAYDMCPACDGTKPKHTHTCRLAALLKELT